MSKNQDLGELINGIKSLGTNQLNAPAYTSATSFTGTLAGLLGFDSSGNIITTSAAGGGVTSFNTRTGAVTLSGSDVTGALGYTPVTQARTLTINGTTYDLSADRSWTVSGSSQWTTSGSNIYFTGGFVGINTTSPQYILDVSGGARFTAWSSMGINARFAWNMISDQYLADGYAGAIRIDNADGRFSFYTAPSGVAGAFPAQTERMTITNVGNVGIGNTSPYGQLTISNILNNLGGINFSNASDASSRRWQIRIDTDVYGDFAIRQSTTQSGTTFANKLYISSTGNVGIGNNYDLGYGYLSLSVGGSKPGILVIKDASNNDKGYLYSNVSTTIFTLEAAGANPLVINTNSAERMRITSAGAVVIGTTTPYRSTGLNIAGLPVGISTRADSSSGGTHIEFVTLGGSIVGNITTNSSNTFYSTSSDYRLKYDYQDLPALDLIDNLKIYQYKWKVDNAIGYGVIAHELQEYLPYAVTGKKDGDQMQAVDYSKLAPIAIAGVKQLNKLFESHTEKIARLESEVAFLKSNIA